MKAAADEPRERMARGNGVVAKTEMIGEWFTHWPANVAGPRLAHGTTAGYRSIIKTHIIRASARRSSTATATGSNPSRSKRCSPRCGYQDGCEGAGCGRAQVLVPEPAGFGNPVLQPRGLPDSEGVCGCR